MTETESMALKWLLDQGFSEQDIQYQYHQSPDFIVRDKGGFEVKTVVDKKTLQFSSRQLEEFSKTNPLILVFRKDDVTPFAKIPFNRIKERFVIYEGRRFNKTLKISDEAHKELGKVVGALRAKDGQPKTFDDAIRYLLNFKQKL